MQFLAETLGMEGNVTERRLSAAITPLWLDSGDGNGTTSELTPPDLSPRQEEAPAPQKLVIHTADMPRISVPILTRHRNNTETNFENTEVEELIAMLRETENLEDQGDILQYLVDTQGLDYNTGEGTIWDNGRRNNL